MAARLFKQHEVSEGKEVNKATEKSRRRALAKFGAVLAFALVVTFRTQLHAGHAAFPGTNGKIAFQSLRDGNAEIYVMNADGSG